MSDFPGLRGRLIGLDHGLARIGIAVSDASGRLARAHSVLTRKSKREDFVALTQIAGQQAAIGWVIGYPSPYDDPDGVYSQAKKVETWVAHLRAETALAIVLWDEQLTSVDAHALAKALRRPPRAPIDDLAARLMLQSYLDALRDGLASAPEAWIAAGTMPTDESGTHDAHD